MAYYDPLIAAWNGATQPPAGVTGTALIANLCATVIAQLNIRDQLIGTLRPGPVVLPP